MVKEIAAKAHVLLKCALAKGVATARAREEVNACVTLDSRRVCCGMEVYMPSKDI